MKRVGYTKRGEMQNTMAEGCIEKPLVAHERINGVLGMHTEKEYAEQS